MRPFITACISLAFLGFCLADGSPVYPGPGYANDQPIYSPETGVAAYSSSPASVSISPVTAASPVESSGYPHDSYPDAYGYPSYDAGYGIQNGYEGYLVPSVYSQLVPSAASGPIGYIYSMLPYPGTVLKAIGRIAVYAATAAAVVSVGVIIVLGICTFTPYCTLTFNGLDSHKFREEVRSLITPDRISAASKFVREAIDKYQNMQKPAH